MMVTMAATLFQAREQATKTREKEKFKFYYEHYLNHYSNLEVLGEHHLELVVMIVPNR